MKSIVSLCRNATIFSADGALDETGFRESLQRFIDADIGVFLASGGSGEGHSLSWQELRRVYEIGVEVCRGKVPVYANPPEQSTAKATIEHSLLAVEAGVEMVNVYGPASSHGYRPTDLELLAYFDRVLSAVQHPVALAPNPIMGYAIKPTLIAEVARRYRHVVAITLSGVTESYFLALRSALNHDVALYVQFSGCLPLLELGASGVLGAEQNVIPLTFREFLQLYRAGDHSGAATLYADIIRFGDYMNQWAPGMIRPLKTAMKILRLPGWAGGLREPYLLLPDAVMPGFTKGLLALGLPELSALAEKARLTD